jgi:hypothetical protein
VGKFNQERDGVWRGNAGGKGKDAPASRNASKEGKVNCQQFPFPARRPILQVAFQLEANAQQEGKSQAFEIGLREFRNVVKVTRLNVLYTYAQIISISAAKVSYFVLKFLMH